MKMTLCLCETFLEEGGFTPEIRRVDTREKLREALSQESWEVVISDYALPAFDGLRALAMVKEWDADVPFIMISGAVGEEFIVEAMRAGAQDFVSKDHLVRLAPSLRRGLAETENRRARRRAERALAESEERYRALFESIDEGFCVIEMLFGENSEPVDYRFLVTNPAFDLQTGLHDVVGKRMRELEPLHEEHWFETYGHIALTGEPERFTREAKHLGNRWYDVYAFRVGLPEERKVAILFHDISARKRAEEALEQELKIRSALNELYQPLISPSSTMESIAMEVMSRAKQLTGSPTGYVSEIDTVTGENVAHSLTKTSQGPCKLEQASQKVVFPKGKDNTYPGLWGHALNIRRPFFTNSPATHSNATQFPEGHIPIDRFLSVPVMLGQEPVGQIALANKPADYTDGDMEAIQRVAHYYALAVQRVRREDQIRASLKEKQVLLQEIHHRVKNNLAIIISLLNLQANKLHDDGVKAAFADCQSRIRSMALIHQTLYQSRNLAELDLERYIRSLVRTVSSAYSHNSSRARFVIRVDKIDLPLDYTIPCGLILNELVSNSIKHAFPNDRQGEIVITVQREDDEIVLIVRDNGVGFARDMDAKNSETLGMFLVVRLGELQLGGKVDVSNDNGAVVTVRFRAPKDGLSRGYKNIT